MLYCQLGMTIFNDNRKGRIQNASLIFVSTIGYVRFASKYRRILVYHVPNDNAIIARTVTMVETNDLNYLDWYIITGYF